MAAQTHRELDENKARKHNMRYKTLGFKWFCKHSAPHQVLCNWTGRWHAIPNDFIPPSVIWNFMKGHLRHIIILIISLCLQNAKGQDSLFRKDNRDIFNLSPTIFLDNGQLGSFSYGINNTTFSPSFVAQQWAIPNYRLNILTKEFKYIISLNRFTFSVKNTNMQELSFNYQTYGINVNWNYPRTTYEFDWKIIKSKRKYAPDFGLGLIFRDGHYPIFLSLGNTKNKLKYYWTVECTLYYIPFPSKYSYGLSYNILKFLDITLEYSHEKNNMNQVLGMLNLSLTKFISIQTGIYNYNYVFEDYIPFSQWTQGGQDRKLDVNPKASYFLASGKIILHLSPFKKLKNNR